MQRHFEDATIASGVSQRSVTQPRPAPVQRSRLGESKSSRVMARIGVQFPTNADNESHRLKEKEQRTVEFIDH